MMAVAAYRAAPGHVLKDDRLKRELGFIGNWSGTKLASAFGHAEQDCLARTMLPLAVSYDFAANQGFVYLDVARQGTGIVGACHKLAKFMGHPPRAYVGDAQLPL